MWFKNIDNERKVIEDQLRLLEEKKQLKQRAVDLYRNVELSQTLCGSLSGESSTIL